MLPAPPAGAAYELPFADIADMLPDDVAELQALWEEALAAEASDRAERIALAETNIFFFGRYYFPDFFPNDTPDFHVELAALARKTERPKSERDTEGFVVAAPRGHAKSTILTFLVPLHWIVFKRKRFIVIASETAMLSEGFVNDIRKQLEENTRLREDFGDLCGDTVAGRRLKWTSKDFVAAHKDAQGRPTFTTRLKARSTGAQFRGLRHGPYRPDAIIIDDAENDVHVRTAEQRAKTWEWLTKTVMPALDPENGALMVIGTILHFDSMLAKLLKLADEAKQARDRAIAEGDPNPPDIAYDYRIFRAEQDDGTLLWPERFNRALLMRRKAIMGELAYNSEYNNRPIDEATRLYRPQWVRWYTGNELEYDARRDRWLWRGEILEIYVGVDPAISEKEQADQFAIVVVGVPEKTRSLVLLYCFADRIDFPSQVQEIIRLEATWRPKLIGVEDQAYQLALSQQALHDAPALPIMPLNNGQSRKYTRILGASLPFEHGTVYMREALDDEAGEHDELRKRRVFHTIWPLYEQMMQYPASAHDDLLDAMENAFQLIRFGGIAFDQWF